jgi:cytidylate kinase
MPARVICISRTSGAGGEQIGRSVAEELGFTYVDDEVIVRAGEKAGIDATLVAQAERRQSMLTRLLDALPRRPLVDAYLPQSDAPRPLPDIHHDDLRHMIREAIHEIGSRGNAVIVAHAASFALAQQPGVLRVLVTASMKERMHRVLVKGRLLNDEDAAAAVNDSDGERAAYLKRFYNISAELPTHYDLVINTDVLPTEAAVAAVVHAARV